jgi:hypothetical protein
MTIARQCLRSVGDADYVVCYLHCHVESVP